MGHDPVPELIERLGLRPHPEGGHYREVHRSPTTVTPDDGRPSRPALTTIYFLLAASEVSRWHRVLSDEAWHYHAGAPLELFVSDLEFAAVDASLVGPFDADAAVEPLRVVPAGTWQAARSTGAYTLVSCSVGPGFVFDDFVMLRDLPEAAAVLARAHPHLDALT